MVVLAIDISGWLGAISRYVLFIAIALISSARADDRCARIVALAPSLVEVVDYLGLTDHLVGVSRFTQYPEAARQLAQVGGLLDPNIEAMMSLRPTLVLGLAEHGDTLTKLNALGIRVGRSDHRSLQGILSSITEIGEICDVQVLATERLRSLDSIVQEYRLKQIGRKPLRALVLIGSKQEALTFSNLYVSGRDGYYSDLLKLAGAVNVFSGITRAFAGISREALIKEDPEVIFHLLTDEQLSSLEAKAIQDAWGRLPYLRAVKNSRVFLLHDYVDVIPGPRFTETLKKFYTFLHQE